ncbi:hypothetical protein G7Z17_g10997 [Cylindrodendrum hubeiense]|uniref:Uncharacterized protein n=1 Tax=Cylindrodendrum hubeiense TaxID=595255 RepID=A0A9P5H616_9HYPO|nr:hypothetical protein G7Z17_g10997 [Cylindrodendrum hubeiense]
MENLKKHPAFTTAKKISFMVGSLVVGVLFAVGQHLFYDDLDGKPPPDSSLDVWHGVSRQKVNIAIGNALAFCTKASLAVAIAAAHDQISWKAIKGRPAEIGLIDALFSSRDDWLSAMNARMWWHMPFPAALLLLFWLLQLAPLITPSALTITTAWLNTTETSSVPQIDFTSMNFASLSWTYSDLYRAMDRTEWQTTELIYDKPQYAVQKAVQGSLISNEILSISAPSTNSSWNLDFHGPALKCTALTDDSKQGLRTRIFTQYAEAWSYGALGGWMSYLSWVPEGTGVNSSLPYTFSGNSTWTPRSTIAGGDPLSLYVMVLPSTSPPDPHHNITTAGIVEYMKQSTILWQAQLQNVSYSADFSFVNGAQDIKLETSEPLNSVDYLSGYRSFIATEDLTYDSNLTQITLNQSAVENFSYQSVMDAFSTMLVGNVTIVNSTVGDRPSVQLNMRTNIAMTPLIKAKEMVNISQALSSVTSNLGNVEWNGKSVYQQELTSRPVVDLMEEMFHNVTLSLMNEAALNPNYSSPYAPADIRVEKWTSQNVYAYSAETLWVTYGIAILATAASVLVGAVVVIASQATYTSQFSTFLRVSQNVYLSDEVALPDTSGKNPLPNYVKKMVVRFPEDEWSGVERKGEMKSLGENRAVLAESDDK